MVMRILMVLDLIRGKLLIKNDDKNEIQLAKVASWSKEARGKAIFILRPMVQEL